MQYRDILKLLVKDLREQCKLLRLDMRENKAPLLEQLNAAREKKLSISLHNKWIIQK